MARLLLVRHGKTEWNEAGRYVGRSDIGLSAFGLREAAALGQRLAGERIDAIYCSDLKRAVQTAQVIASGRNVEPMTREELREMDFGEFEGLTLEEIRQRRPEFDWWTARDADMQFPQGESVRRVVSRVGPFAGRLESYAEGETVLIVSHGGTLRALICLLLGLDLEHWWQIALDSASLTVVDTYPERTVLSLLNDVCHLSDLKKERP